MLLTALAHGYRFDLVCGDQLVSLRSSQSEETRHVLRSNPFGFQLTLAGGSGFVCGFVLHGIV